MSSEKEVVDVSETVSMQKYYIPGEDYSKMAIRVGNFIAAAEKSIDQMNQWGIIFTNLIDSKTFIPGGRILANAGTYFDDLNEDQKKFLIPLISNYKDTEKRCGQMLNCYVLPVYDSKHGPGSIYESLEDAADITAMEGGIGENFSFIRPKDFIIAGNKRYKASGPVSFLKVYNSSGEQLSQGGGRRDANMAVLNCDHPDIFEFVNCKRTEGEIKSYNISVGIYDEFMKAVEKNLTWDLKWDGKVIKTIAAVDLFENIVHNIWADGGGGEPGVLFLDTARKFWPFIKENPITTNPCITEDIWIETREGPKQVKDLIGNKFLAKVNYEEYISISNGFFKTGNKEVFLFDTYEGYCVKLTKDHEVYISKTEKKKASEFKEGDILFLNYDFPAKFKSMISLGFQDVYDVQIDIVNKYSANGIMLSNCGEQFLGFYEACDLGAINLFKFIRKTSNGVIFDKVSFRLAISNCIRFLDNVLEVNNYPLKYRDDICRKISMKHRRIGLGIMGFADVLFALNIRYGSPECVEFINEIMHHFDMVSNSTSMALGQEKGPFLDHLEAYPNFHNRRNCATTTIAPTGTTSMVAGVSGGCEPHFGLVIRKKTTDGSGNVYYMVPDSFKLLCAENNIELTDKRLEEIYNNSGSVQGLEWFPKSLQKVVVTTMDITAMEHVAVQCAFQKHIENSISKTINLPKTASKKDVEESIFGLWKGGAKGGTLYRDGSRDFQIMNVGGSEKKSIITAVSNPSIMDNRPRVLTGKTHKVTSKITHNSENIYITVNEDENKKPVEIFVHHSSDQSISDLLDFMIHNGVKPDIAQMLCGKMIQMAKENVTLTTRLISLCLRNSVDLHNIVKQLRKINNSDIHSLHKHLAKILGEYISSDIKVGDCKEIINGNICGGKIIYQEGCTVCIVCNHSKCG